MTRSSAAPAPVVERVNVSAFTIPTERPESDGTLEWSSTTLIVVEATADNETGVGYSYGAAAAAKLIVDVLIENVRGQDAMAVGAAWQRMRRAVRNAGAAGVAATAISAVDNTLWDLKARLLRLPLVSLLGRVRDDVPVYGSGGFTSYSIDEVAAQLASWTERGMRAVKMKVGRMPPEDAARVAAARNAIGDRCRLFVDANGAYTATQALALAARFRDSDVSWFEEPVSSDDVAGLQFVRERAPAGMEIAAGEYVYSTEDALRLVDAAAVDVLQLDATRCLGITGFLRAAALAEAHHVPISTHTASAQHAAVACAVDGVVHVEHFFDHARIEEMLFDGAPVPIRGVLRPDLSAPGNGLRFKRGDAQRFAV